jgi:hypothetical protein
MAIKLANGISAEEYQLLTSIGLHYFELLQERNCKDIFSERIEALLHAIDDVKKHY